MKCLLLISLLLCAPLALAQTYVSQPGGTFSGGSACNGQTAESVATFNGSALTAGNTYVLCGTITSRLTPSGSGTSGSPITILWDTGAVMSLSPANCNSSAVVLDGLSWYVLNGGSNGIIQCSGSGNPAFSMNGASYSCNGTTCTITCASANPQCAFFTATDVSNGVPSAYAQVVLSGMSQSSLDATVEPTTYTGCANTGYTTPCSASFAFAAPGGFSGSGSLTAGSAGVYCPGTSAYCTAEDPTVVGIHAEPCNNCQIENLTITTFFEWCPTCAGAVNFGATGAIFAGSNTSGSFLTINNNTFHDNRASISYTPTVSSDNALSCGTSSSPASGVWQNTMYYGDGMNFENNGVSSSGVCFHDNYVHDTINWDSSYNWGASGASYSCDYHHDGIHFWALTGGVTTGSQIYNNWFSGAWGACPTGAIFLEGRNDQWLVYNNIATTSYLQEQNGVFNFNGEGTVQYYNNTIIGANSASYQGLSDLCLNFGTPAGTFTLKAENNATLRCNTLLEIQNSPTLSTVNYNAWGECTPSSGNCNGGTPFVINSSFDSFSTWQGLGVDANGLYNATSGHYNLTYATGVPNSSSALVGAGTNLTSLSITPLDSTSSAGNQLATTARGSSGNWTIGALNASGSTYTITISPSPTGGSVTDSQSLINCPSACTTSLASGTDTLTFTANHGYSLQSVTGCTLSGNTCSVTTTATISATFMPVATPNPVMIISQLEERMYLP